MGACNGMLHRSGILLLLHASRPPVLSCSCCMQAPKGATQSAGVVVEQSSSCLYVKVRTPRAPLNPLALQKIKVAINKVAVSSTIDGSLI